MLTIEVYTVKFIAIKLDVVHSRRVADRTQLQAQLFSVTDDNNIRFRKHVQADFIVTHGDEVQGLLKYPCEDLFAVLERYNDALRPHFVRAGIGLGTLSTPLQTHAIGMDGPAWHRAKEAIETASSDRKFVAFQGFGAGEDAVCTSLGNMLLWQRSRWTDSQRNIIERLDLGMKQKDIAEEMGVSPAAVSKSLTASGWRHYQEARKVMRMYLKGDLS